MYLNTACFHAFPHVLHEICYPRGPCFIRPLSPKGPLASPRELMVCMLREGLSYLEMTRRRTYTACIMHHECVIAWVWKCLSPLEEYTRSGPHAQQGIITHHAVFI